MYLKNIKSMKIITCFYLTFPSPPSARESRRKQGEEPAYIPKKPPDLDFSGLITPKYETKDDIQKKWRLFWSCMQNTTVF